MTHPEDIPELVQATLCTTGRRAVEAVKVAVIAPAVVVEERE